MLLSVRTAGDACWLPVLPARATESDWQLVAALCGG